MEKKEKEDPYGVFRHDIKNQLMSMEYVTFLKEDGFKVEYMDLILAQLNTIQEKVEGNDFTITDEINAVIGIVNVVKKTTEDEGIKKFLEVIMKSLKTMKAIAKLANACGKISKPKEFVFRQIINEIRSHKMVNIFYDNSLLVFEGGCYFPETVLNLIQNSVYHGGATEIKIRTRKTEKGVSIIIEDNGTGIPASVKGKVFQKGVTTRSTGKGGDGLFFVRQILKSSGILIRETSRKGKGARFEVMVPNNNIRCYKESTPE